MKEILKAERRKAFIDKNPQLAFLFNPNYSDEEKAEIAKKSNVTITLEDRQEFSGISAEAKNKIKRSLHHVVSRLKHLNAQPKPIGRFQFMFIGL